MKRLLVFVAVVALLGACHRGGGSSGSGATATQTETIAPAASQPGQTGTDALTQTTDIEDSRSEEDGGVTSPNASATSTTTNPSAKPAKAPAKKHKK